MSSSATVGFKPLGYCSVTAHGIESVRAAESMRCAVCITAGNRWITPRNASWMSQHMKTHVAGSSRPRRAIVGDGPRGLGQQDVPLSETESASVEVTN